MFSASKSLVLLSAHHNVALSLYYRYNYSYTTRGSHCSRLWGIFLFWNFWVLVDKYLTLDNDPLWSMYWAHQHLLAFYGDTLCLLFHFLACVEQSFAYTVIYVSVVLLSLVFLRIFWAIIKLNMCPDWNGGRMDRYFNYMNKCTHLLAVKLPFKSQFLCFSTLKI